MCSIALVMPMRSGGIRRALERWLMLVCAAPSTAFASTVSAGTVHCPRTPTAKVNNKPTTTTAHELFEVVDEPTSDTVRVSSAPRVVQSPAVQSNPFEESVFEVPRSSGVTHAIPAEPAIFTVESLPEVETPTTADTSSVMTVSAEESLPGIDPELQTLILELTDDDHEIRQMAAFTLGEYGEAARIALPALRQSMHSNYTMVRLHAAEAVAKLSPGNEAAYEALLRGLEDSNSEVRVMAATALMSVAPVHRARAMESLQSLRSDPKEHVRLLAETAMPIDNAEPIAPLPQEAYELPTRTVQATPRAADAMIATEVEVSPAPQPVNVVSSQTVVEPQADAFDEHFLETKPSSTPLETLFPEPPTEVERDSVEQIETAAVTTAPTLSPDLAELATRLGSTDAIQLKYALSELVWYGADARPVLPHVQKCLTSTDEVVRAHAAKAMHDIAPDYDQQAIAVLAELVQSLQPGVSPLAAYFLGEFDSQAITALPALRKALSESVGMDQLHIAEAILRIEPQDGHAATVLTNAVSAADESSRFFAACALVAAAPHQGELVVPALLTAQNDASARVRMAADTTLTGFHTEPKGVAAVVIAEPEPQPEPEPVAVEEVPVFDPVVIADTAEESEAKLIETVLPGGAQVQLVQVEVPSPQTNAPTTDTADVVPPEFDTNLPVKPWTAQTPGETKPIRYVTINTAPQRRDADGRLQELPTNYGAAFLEKQGQTRHGQESRPWLVQSKAYEAPAFCHRPLYFEDVNLERYGHHFHCVQPLVSAAHFFGRVPFLPYLATVSKPWECEYPLGKYRPGDCTPYQFNYVPLQADAVLVQAGFTAVPFFIIH